MKKYLHILTLVFPIVFILVTSCSDNSEKVGKTSGITVEDFHFVGPLGSENAQIVKINTNHFRITLGHAPNNPQWPNKLNFEILQNAKGNDLNIEVEFSGGSSMAFNEYAQSWSYDGMNWHPVHWKKGFRDSPQYDVLVFPVFEKDRVFVGTQVPMSFKDAESLKKQWAKHPHANLHIIGKSIQGRPLYRLEIIDTESPEPMVNRWGHYFANQHPGEHNSQWRMAGMVDWILSEEGADYRQRNVSHFVFFMSPDAPTHGWYRVNQEGVDMNRSYRPEGSSRPDQTHEAFKFQKDLEKLMTSEVPITTIWAMHTWQGIVEPLMRAGPEFGSNLGPWTDLRDIIIQNDPDSLIKPLVVRDGMGYGPVSWTDGPHQQFGISAILCEGGGSFYTKEVNIASGEILIKSIAEFYSMSGKVFPNGKNKY